MFVLLQDQVEQIRNRLYNMVQLKGFSFFGGFILDRVHFFSLQSEQTSSILGLCVMAEAATVHTYLDSDTSFVLLPPFTTTVK